MLCACCTTMCTTLRNGSFHVRNAQLRPLRQYCPRSNGPFLRALHLHKPSPHSDESLKYDWCTEERCTTSPAAEEKKKHCILGSFKPTTPYVKRRWKVDTFNHSATLARCRAKLNRLSQILLADSVYFKGFGFSLNLILLPSLALTLRATPTVHKCDSFHSNFQLLHAFSAERMAILSLNGRNPDRTVST